MASNEETPQAEADPRWEVQPEPPDETPEQGTLLRIAVAVVVVALAASVFLALATRGV